MQKSRFAQSEYLPIYAGALAFIGMIVLASFFMLERVVAEQESIGRALQAASHQHKQLTTARHALDVLTLSGARERREDSLARLDEAITGLAGSRGALTALHEDTDMPATTQALLDNAYFEGSEPLDRNLVEYLDDLMAVRGDLRNGTQPASALIDALTGPSSGRLSDRLGALSDRLIEQFDVLNGRLTLVLRVFHFGIIAGLVGVGLFVFYPLFHRLQIQRRRLQTQATLDPLTGVLNRRSFYAACGHEFARARRYGGNLSVMILDLDNFKKLNDTYGHATGDDVLRTMTGICQEKLRRTDVFARIGGEEFAAILPETSEAEAVAVADKLRDMLSNTSVSARGSNELVRFTVSIGVAQYAGPETDPDFDSLLHRTDMRLYEAKRLGRNRVVSWDSEIPQPGGEGVRVARAADRSRLDLN